MSSFAGARWRRAARLGALHGPQWVLRVAAPLVGVIVWAVAGADRRTIGAALRRVRGPKGWVRDGVDSARTFATYASCITEILGAEAPRARPPEVLVRGELNLFDALATGRGLVLATAHTAGWDAVGPLLARDFGLEVMIAVSAERDPATRGIQDAARRATGVLVAHVGDDPLAALPLAAHLRTGGAVALQVDRVPAGIRARSVSMFGRQERIPEGPLRLGALTGAPVVPIFVSRAGHRRYEVVVHPAVRLARSPSEDELDAAAQRVAGAMEAAIRAHPTQWFPFGK